MSQVSEMILATVSKVEGISSKSPDRSSVSVATPMRL
jgi:hypothetical protein